MTNKDQEKLFESYKRVCRNTKLLNELAPIEFDNPSYYDPKTHTVKKVFTKDDIILDDDYDPTEPPDRSKPPEQMLKRYAWEYAGILDQDYIKEFYAKLANYVMNLYAKKAKEAGITATEVSSDEQRDFRLKVLVPKIAKAFAVNNEAKAGYIARVFDNYMSEVLNAWKTWNRLKADGTEKERVKSPTVKDTDSLRAGLDDLFDDDSEEGFRYY